MVESHHIVASRRARPVLGTVQTVFIDHILGIRVVQQRELHGEGIVDIRQLKAVAAHDRCLTHVEASELHLLLTGTIMPEVVGHKRGETVAETKPDTIACGMHGRTVHILAAGQAIAVQIAHKLLVVAFILPDTHRGATPDVASTVFNDIIHHLVFECLRTLKGNHLFLFGIIGIETRGCAYQEMVVARLVHSLHGIIVEQHLPAIGMEIVFIWVVTIDTRGCTHPDFSPAVGIEL